MEEDQRKGDETLKETAAFSTTGLPPFLSAFLPFAYFVALGQEHIAKGD
jgi:hypothetical protein